MWGWVIVEAAGYASDADLDRWVSRAVGYVRTIPPTTTPPKTMPPKTSPAKGSSRQR